MFIENCFYRDVKCRQRDFFVNNVWEKITKQNRKEIKTKVSYATLMH